MGPKKDNRIMYLGVGIVAYLMFLILALHIGTLMGENPNGNILNVVVVALQRASAEPFNFTITAYTFKAIGIVTVIFAICIMMVMIEAEKNARSMPGKENGSSQWNTNLAQFDKKFNSPYGKPTHDDPENMILSQNVRLGIKGFKTQRNMNVIVIGGSGSGKSRFFIKPNGLQANTNFVFTDPSGELLASMGKFLEEQGYNLKVFNLVDMEHSHCYNPFAYIRDDLGVVSMVNCLIKNTTPPGKGGGDPFWEKSETALLQALIFYLRECAPAEQQNFTSVMKLLRAADVDENNLNKKSDLDRLFDQLEEKNPKSIALKQYKTFKMGSGKTLKSILISCSVRLTVFNMKEIEALTGTDTIALDTMGCEKQALFVILPQADDTYNFLASLMYSQLYETLYFQGENEWPNSYIIKNNNQVLENIRKLAGADANDGISYDPEEKAKELLRELKKAKLEENKDNNTYYIKYKYFNTKIKQYEDKRRTFITKKLGEEYLDAIKTAKIEKGANRLPIHVSFLLDEFANIGQIPEFDKKMATMRKYEISSVVVLQNLAQIKEIYDKKAEGVIGNADSMVFLGSSEPETCKYISEKLGSSTIVVRNNSRSMGSKGSSSLSYNRNKRELMTPDEVSRMPDTDCIVFVRGQQPFYGPKYDYTKHPNYHLTGDADKKNLYNLQERVSNRKNTNEAEMKCKEQEVKRKNALSNYEKQKPVKADKIQELLNISDPLQIPNVLSAFNPEPEINIRRNIQTTNKEEKKRETTQKTEEQKERNKRDKSEQEEWNFTSLH